VRATLGANVEMLALYWDVGCMIEQRQKAEGWGAAVIPRLARDIRNELTEIKEFSERNLKRMVAFYREYSVTGLIVPQLAAQRDIHPILPQPVAGRCESRRVSVGSSIQQFNLSTVQLFRP
jgi:hypothetical protein